MSSQVNCEYCSNYVYDEDYEYYVCDMDIDEDDMVRLAQGRSFSCPYFRFDDEYQIVRKQNG
jgi:pyruvate-formate lyase-activating enzyme